MNIRLSFRAPQWAWLGRLPILALALSLSGCMQAQAPLLPLLGSYFPSWLLCAFIGVITAVIVRVVFIRLGIDEELRWRLFVYVCLALAVAFVCSLLLFAR
ncbi:YtcA family lipoprotein [Serratia sp. L9]|uniref:YtcA family lipoprotein n=1 Tax=Serratia sp. L9 TaxID=3423946 RepID=UPI003D66CE22